MKPFTSSVVSGSGRGKSIGFPTINLDIQNVPTDLEEGVYACTVQIDSQSQQQEAAMHFGKRPTYGDSPSCEVHIINADILLPVDSLTVLPVQKMRCVMKFDSSEDLVIQLQSDIKQARAILNVL